MTETPTRAELEAMLKRAEAATPGPWQHGFDDGSGIADGDRSGGWIVSEATQRNAVTCDIVQGTADEDDPLSGVIRIADAEFIAAARTDLPRTARALLAAMERDESLSFKVSELSNALRWYAAKNTWKVLEKDTQLADIDSDQGHFARQILAKCSIDCSEADPPTPQGPSTVVFDMIRKRNEHIDALTARVAGLEGALRPFARMMYAEQEYKHMPQEERDAVPINDYDTDSATWGDVRAARAALSRPAGEGAAE